MFGFGFGWGFGFYRKAVTIDLNSGRKAPRNCPKCSRRMITRIVFFECRGCGYVENTPKAKRRYAREQLEADHIHGVRLSDSALDPTFALATVSTKLAVEYRTLCAVGLTLFLMLVVAWGGAIGMDYEYYLSDAFRAFWQLTVAGCILLALALLSSSRPIKQFGIVAAVLTGIAAVASGLLLPAEAKASMYEHCHDPLDVASVWFSIHMFYFIAAHCIWVAWFKERERQTGITD